MILVTGVTGTIGKELVRLLAERGEAVRAMTRNPAGADLPPGVDAVYGDFDDRASLGPAMEGISTLFLLTAPGTATSEHDEAGLEAARRAGVARAVKLSAIATGEIAPDGEVVGSSHLRGEQALQKAGLDWTILRPTTFASNTLSWAASISQGEPIANLTGNARQGVVDPRDVAAVAAEVLTGTGHEGRTYTLTGPELLSVPDQAVQLGEVLGRTIKTNDVPPDSVRDFLIAAGMSEVFAKAVASGSAFVVAGRNAVLTEDLERILGRPGRTYRAWAQDHQNAFTSGR